MAEVKKINDQYTISAPTIIIDGNLTVSGSTTSVETTNSTITDNTIVLNEGESGAGITAGSSGIEVDRGSLDNATFLFNEADDVWENKIGSSFSIVRGGTPVGGYDLATKNYVDATSSGAVVAAGNNTEIQFNNSGIFGADANLTWDGSTLSVTGDITSTANIAAVDFNASGIMTMENTSAPSSAVGENRLYSASPAGGGTGLYFVNSTNAGEFVSKEKAIVFGIIF